VTTTEAIQLDGLALRTRAESYALAMSHWRALVERIEADLAGEGYASLHLLMPPWWRVDLSVFALSWYPHPGAMSAAATTTPICMLICRYVLGADGWRRDPWVSDGRSCPWAIEWPQSEWEWEWAYYASLDEALAAVGRPG